MGRVAPRCLHCSEPVAKLSGQFSGQYFAYGAGQVGDHSKGQVHVECNEAFQRKFARTCLQCGEPVMAGKFSGKHFNYQDGHFGRHGTGPVHEECHASFLRRWVPACLHCQEPLVPMPGKYSGKIKAAGGGGAGAVHEECYVAFLHKSGHGAGYQK